MTGSLTPLAAALLAGAAAAAAADWAIVARDARRGADTGVGAGESVGEGAGGTRPQLRARLVTKPLVLILLVGSAVALEPRDPAVRAWFVVALVASLAGDVALLSPRGFVAGLAAFLAGHLAYAVGFVVGGIAAAPLVVGLAVMVLVDAVLVRRLVPALRAVGHGRLVPPVLAYVVAITLMVATAAGSAIPLAVAGAALFAASDALLADGRFVRRRQYRDVTVMVLYHLAQAFLVLSLVA